MTVETAVKPRRGSWAKFFGVLAMAVAGIYVLMIAGLYFGQRIMIFPSLLVDPGSVAMKLDDSFEAVTVTTADGEKLKAFWKAPAAGAPVLLVFHGNQDVPQTYSSRFDQGVWDEAGYGILAVAYRGYPGSTGETSETGLIADAEAARLFVLGRLPNAEIVYYGHSLGTGVAVALSELHPSLGLFLEAPYTSIADMVGIRVPIAPRMLVRDPLHSDERLVNSKADVIIIAHGEQDESIPFSFGERLAATNPRAEFINVVGAGHQSLLGQTDAYAAAAFVKALADR